MPKMGLQMEVKLSTGALRRMAPQDTRIAKTRMDHETIFLLILSSGMRRRSTFIAIPWHASRKPRNTPKYAVITAKMLRIKEKILTVEPPTPWATIAKVEMF